jgi:hypothetical protein
VPRGLGRAALCAGVLFCGPALAVQPHERADGEPVEFAAGDDLQHVLAFLRHPESGIGAAHLRVQVLSATGATTLPPESLAPGKSDFPPATYLVDITQKCDKPGMSEEGRAFTSWFYLPDGQLAAWDVQTYGPGCRTEPRLFETSDHEAMRSVGRALFRPTREGRFRYGALRYRSWDDAFGAPTREAMISLLRKQGLEQPTSARAQNALAVGLYAAGQRDAAIETLKHAAELAPDWDLPHENLALALRERGELGAAERESQLAETLRKPPVGAGPGAREALRNMPADR